jgi:hypothetical protein
MHPELELGPISEVNFAEDRTTTASASETLSAGGTPASAQASTSWTLSHQRHVEYSRRTQSKVHGNGVKTKIATWILQGDSGQHGLQATERLSLTTSVRPSMVTFSLNVVVMGVKFKQTQLQSGFITQRFGVSSLSTPPVPPEPRSALVKGFFASFKEKFH